MATTPRRASRAGQRQAASPRATGKHQLAAKRGNGGANGSRKRPPAKAKSTKRTVGGKEKGDKMVRDTFKMPQREYDLIAEIKQRCRALGVQVKKSDVLRAGLAAMRDLSDQRLGEVMRPLTAARAERAARKQATSATAA